MSEKEAFHLTANDELSYREWKLVRDFFEKGNIAFDSLEPSKLDYNSVQKNIIDDTIVGENRNIENIHKERNRMSYLKSRPSIKEGAKVTAVSSFIEGGTTFALEIIKKIKTGKSLQEFTPNDWKEIGCDTTIAAGKGGIRGTSIYLLTNYTATPGSVASGVVTASFGIAEQAHLYRSNKITEAMFIENAEMVAVDAAVSALSSLIGRTMIPIPVLGAVIGNATGVIISQAAKGKLSAKEEKIINEYIKKQHILDKQLEEEYGKCIEELSRNLKIYMEILENAFALDFRAAFESSFLLCREVGVPYEEILSDRDMIDQYFLA